MNREPDELLNFTFRQPEHATSWLRSVLPAALAEAIDWRSLRLRSSDRSGQWLFSVQLRRRELWILVLAVGEAEAGDAALRFLELAAHEWRRWRRDGGGPLPAIVPLLLHHGARARRSGCDLLGQIDLHDLPAGAARVLAPLQPNLHFLQDDLAAESEGALLRRDGTALMRLSLLCRQCLPADDDGVLAALVRWRQLLRLVQVAPGGRAAALRLLSLLLSKTRERPAALGEALLRIDPNAEQTIMNLAEKMRLQGAAAGEARGELRGRAALLLRQLEHRFGPLPPASVARVRKASVAELDAFGERVLSATSLQEVLGER